MLWIIRSCPVTISLRSTYLYINTLRYNISPGFCPSPIFPGPTQLRSRCLALSSRLGLSYAPLWREAAARSETMPPPAGRPEGQKRQGHGASCGGPPRSARSARSPVPRRAAGSPRERSPQVSPARAAGPPDAAPRGRAVHAEDADAAPRGFAAQAEAARNAGTQLAALRAAAGQLIAGGPTVAFEGGPRVRQQLDAGPRERLAWTIPLEGWKDHRGLNH